MATLKNTKTTPNTLNELDVYRFTLDSARELIWLWDIASGNVSVFGDAQSLFGSEVSNKRTSIEWWISGVHPDDKADAQKKAEQIIKGLCSVYEHTYRIKNGHGQWIWFQSKTEVYERYPNGKVKTIVGRECLVEKQKQLEQEVVQSKRFLDEAFTGTYDTIWNWDLETDIIDVSKSWQEALGLPPNQAIHLKQSWDPLIHPDDKKPIYKKLIQVFKGINKAINLEYRIKTKNSEYRWIMVRGHVAEVDHQGKAMRVVGILNDIDRIKTQEESIKERNQQFALSMYSTGSTLVEYDLLSHTFTHLGFQLSEGEIETSFTTKPLTHNSKTIHDDDRAVFSSYLKSLYDKDQELKTAKWRSNYLGGEFKWHETKSLTTVFDKQGNPTKATGIRQDIHEAYVAQLRIREQQERDSLVLKGSLNGVWEWDLKSGEFTINSNIIEALVKDPSTWQNTIEYWRGFMHPHEREDTIERAQNQIINKNAFINLEYRVKLLSNEWAWLASKGTITQRNNYGTPLRVVGSIIDITEQKRVEHALENEKRLAQTTLESINEAVLTTDINGTILTLNHKAEQLFSIKESKAINSSLGDLCQLREESSDTKANNPISICIKSDLAFNLSKLTLTNTSKKIFNIEASLSPLHDIDNEVIGCVMVLRDVTRSRKITREIEHRAQHDALTGISNRHSFESTLARMTQADEYEHILCYIDLDQFKIVNDTCGHVAGDELLRQLSSELSKVIRKSDFFARLGGDEFGVLMQNCNIAQALKAAEQIKQAVADYTFHWEDKTFQIGASIGLAPLNPTTSPTLAMQHADAACFSAKEQGRNRIHSYRSDDSELAATQGQMGWVPRLQKALLDDSFVLYAQAIINLQTPDAAPSHFEILIRLNNDGKIVPPGAFLPAAERYNLAYPIDLWVIENTFKTLNEYSDQINADDTFNINLSADTLCSEGALDVIQQAFKTSNINPKQVCFEITETAAVTNLTAANNLMKELKKLGCEFALDDFGSGLSSFGYLKNFPVDYLKIDGLFVKDLIDDPIDAAMVKSINEIGRILGKKTVAEFVENQEIADVLTHLGVNYAQGYHFSVPSPFIDILKNR